MTWLTISENWNKMSHPLHEKIGTILEDISFPSYSNYSIIKDPACGGNQNIPLFCSKVKSNATEYCNVDLLILKNDKIKVIIEIEETNIKPTQICGKFLTSALSQYFIHRRKKDKPFGMDDSVSFIQIIDTLGLKKDKTSKIDQFENIEKSIHEILPIKNSRIDKYKLFYYDGSSPNLNLNNFLDYIKIAIT